MDMKNQHSSNSQAGTLILHVLCLQKAPLCLVVGPVGIYGIVSVR